MRSNNITRAVVQDVLRIVSEVRTERAVADMSGVSDTKAHKTAVTTNIQKVRRSAISTTDNAPHHAAMDAVHDVEAAISSLQGDINATITDVGRATTPEQRSNAERRLAKLMEQKRRLEVQLGLAKMRQVNAVGAGKAELK